MGEFFRDVIIDFIPAHFFKRPVSLDHRRIQPLGVVVELKGKPPLQTGMPLVHFGVIGGGDTQDFPIVGGNIQVTAHPAIGTNGTGGLRGLYRFGLEHIGNSRGRACLGAGAATHTVRFHKALVQPLDNPGVKPTTGHTQDKFPLHLIAGTYAPIAVDTLT